MAGRRQLICTSGELADGGDGVRFEFERFGRREPAFAVRFEGQIHAYVNRCAHVPSQLDWLPGRFFDGDGRLLICATHGAVYDPASGACRGGPCRGGLERLAVLETDGAVWLVD